MLASVRPARAQGEEVRVRDLLDEAVRELEQGSLNDQPAVEAAIRRTIGETYAALGRYEDAGAHLLAALTINRRLLGDEHPDLARSMYSLGDLRYAQGDYDGAERLFRDALRVFQNA